MALYSRIRWHPSTNKRENRKSQFKTPHTSIQYITHKKTPRQIRHHSTAFLTISRQTTPWDQASHFGLSQLLAPERWLLDTVSLTSQCISAVDNNPPTIRDICAISMPRLMKAECMHEPISFSLRPPSFPRPQMFQSSLDTNPRLTPMSSFRVIPTTRTHPSLATSKSNPLLPIALQALPSCPHIHLHITSGSNFGEKKHTGLYSQFLNGSIAG